MLLKYMGTVDRRGFLVGENFGGRLGSPLDRDVWLHWGNDHMLNTEDPEYVGISPTFWELLAEQPDIMDVTNMDPIPLNDAQRLHRPALKETDDSRWTKPDPLDAITDPKEREEYLQSQPHLRRPTKAPGDPD